VGWMTRLVRPTSSGWVGPQDRRQPGHWGPQPPGQPHRLAVVLSRRRLLAARVLSRRRLLAARVVDGVLGLAVGAVERVVVITPLAADQDPGQDPLTGQPPTGRRRQRSRPAGLTTHPRRAAQQPIKG
jgi:hypothetical protein